MSAGLNCSFFLFVSPFCLFLFLLHDILHSFINRFLCLGLVVLFALFIVYSSMMNEMHD